ncbi:MAG TPA: hypothetical protein VKB93_26600 [Thermoanaerobaculia bacterium]|nr:hypothetical protein [Thermoanaerobaculia bacterium]
MKWIAFLALLECGSVAAAFESGGLAAAVQKWTAHPAHGVEMHLSREGEVNRLDFDFHGHGGYAIARRDVELDLPPNYQFTFRVRGETETQTLEFKLVRGDDVWWINRLDFAFPREWQTLTTKKRQISFAWGPSGGGELRHINAMEVVVTASSGGKGTVWFTDPVLEELPLVTNEIGGLIVDCANCSVPGAVQERVGNQLFVWLPATPTQVPQVDGKVTPMPVDWAPTKNDFCSIVAKHARRGDYPRYFLGEQSYWTVIGADGAEHEALVSEDGAVEPFKSGESIEPFLHVNGKRLTWADVEITQSLAEGDLPIPSVTWKTKGASMTMTAAVSSSSMLQLRYRVRGDASLELKVRPFQVNPSTQFLNTEGGVTRVFHELRLPKCATGCDIDIPLQPGAKRESFEKIAADWREKLHRVTLDIAGAPEIADTIRANLAYTLIHRDGPALQPGSRSYERAWIRDGALISSLLLRLGHADVAKHFATWFASFQYENGKVPCCVDKRGADPVPENDSHGELIFLAQEIERYTGEKLLQPNVAAARRYIEELRSQNHGEFEGLVTESISHEGYSAKPVHSYWDDFFCLKGNDTPDFRRDLTNSIRRTIEKHHLDYVPSSVELADFDPTSTSIAISPLGLMSLFPEKELRRTYEKYLSNLARPRADYTPYEMRNIGALIRLGERNRALQLVDRFMLDRRPAGWKQWAEVVRTEYRKAGFVGDMPHAWVASDFMRSILEAIVYERDDGTLVIGAGVPTRWLPLHVGPLPTSQGVIDLRIDRDGSIRLKGATRYESALSDAASNK